VLGNPNITKGADGKLVTTLDSPDQGARGIPVEETSFEKGHLRLTAKSINGGFEGDINAEYSSINGTWTQNGGSLPLVLNRTDKVTEVIRPQDPKPPYPYDEKEVDYANKQAGITLAGTLTLPRSGGPFPAVILISGSGPEDRNETVFGHHPFLVLADYLTRNGIAVLRVDDRGVGKSTGDFKNATSEDFVGDVLSGIDYLKSQKDINPKQIGLIGHSEGGTIAPMAASKSSDIAFIVMMAGPGVTGEQIIYLQSALIYKSAGVSDAMIAKDRKLKEQAFAIVKQEPDTAIAGKKLREVLGAAIAQLSDEEKQTLEYTPEALDVQIQQVNSPWLRYFLINDPRPALLKVKCPVLAINGEKDMQVPPKENLKAVGEALKAGGNKDFTTKELPGLNHLFQTAKTGSPVEYSSIDETISPVALKTIGDWIINHTKIK
jgi:fermentation-respiration switch protein FrsA (DUF1100 family)